MNPGSGEHGQDHLESVFLYALRALPATDLPAVEAQISACADCWQELQSLRPVMVAFVTWPTDVVRPPTSLWDRVTRRITADTGGEPVAEPPLPPQMEWAEAAPGISCKLLATDMEEGRVSMLVKLAPGAEYPPHVHAGVEELHMLHGELMVDDKRLVAGDYLRSEPGSEDHRVWSKTGCTGVLITSIRDVLR